MITATTKQQHYLKQFAALRFPGSIETHGTIHVLEQQIPREAGDFYPIMEFSRTRVKVCWPMNCLTDLK